MLLSELLAVTLKPLRWMMPASGGRRTDAMRSDRLRSSPGGFLTMNSTTSRLASTHSDWGAYYL